MYKLRHTRKDLACALFSVASLLLLSACATTNRSDYSSASTCTYTKEQIDSIRQQAKDGDTAKLLELADMYDLGHCLQEARFELKQEAAFAGSASAQRGVALGYYSGQGVEQDLVKAEYWFRKAAEQGDRTSQHRLGLMYQKGIGINQDLEEAKKWYEKSSEQGDYGSKNALEALVCEMDIDSCGNQFGEATRNKYEERGKLAEARREEKRSEFLLLTESAKLGDPVAQYRLGEIYSSGDSEYPTKQNLYIASTWFHKSADQGYSDAQFALGLMYETGAGGNEKLSYRAKDLYMKAAAQGHPTAKRRLCASIPTAYRGQPTAPQHHITDEGEVFCDRETGDPADLLFLLCLTPYTIWLCMLGG
ncbi:sel1 repeat family protein [Gammaproteobacteria bacterium]|nr:sel1 repeat family protein [Gammaproteobacteria bacterium]